MYASFSKAFPKTTNYLNADVSFMYYSLFICLLFLLQAFSVA